MSDALSLLYANDAVFAVAVAALVAILGFVGLLGRLADRPLLALALGLGAGVGLRSLGTDGPTPDVLREAARVGLGLLAFTAAQQVRLSRLPRLSQPALRLSLLGTTGMIVVSTAAVYALLPSLGPWSALIVAVTLPLGLGAYDERLALNGPLSPETKRAVRLDAALGIAVFVPLAVVIEAVSVPPQAGAPLTEAAGFVQFAGAAVGGTIGLLAGRLLPVGDGAVPAAPLITFAVAYVGASLLGFDPVMAAALGGILYAEEAPLNGAQRSRLFSAGARWCGPPAFFVLAALYGPMLLQANLLVWLAALVPVLALRVVARSASLGGTDLAPADRSFLSWFGGSPGAGAALFLVSLIGSQSPTAQPLTLNVAVLSAIAGLVMARLASGPLVTRQIRAAARARRKRYGAT